MSRARSIPELIFLLLVISLFCQTVGGQPWDGNGVEGDPYLIYTDEELNLIGLFSSEWDKHFLLCADIDLSGFTGTEFNIIGYKGAKFTGVFDGNGHTISNFTYTSPYAEYASFFRYVGGGGEIKDLGLFNVNINGSNAGALVGDNYGTVSNCFAEGTVAGYNTVGGLIGINHYGTVSNCYATGVVSGYAASCGLPGTGGLIGYNLGGTVSGSYATGTVTGLNGVGGLVGNNSIGGTILNCYATVTTMGDWLVGGLVGGNYDTVSNCYATGAVTGSSSVGGLVGENGDMYRPTATVSNCYATGSVTGDTFVGGLVGGNYDTVSICYATGSVTGYDFVGGLVGGGGTLSNCYATGVVTGTGYRGGIGGLVGSCGRSILNCYATGAVDGNDKIGGLAGTCGGSISNCYSSGPIDGNDNTGGLVGYHSSGDYTNCFWDSDINPDVNGIGNTTDPNVIGESTANMQTQSTFTDVGWDFMGEIVNGTEDIWRMCVDDVNYPMLWLEFVDGDFVCPDGVDSNDLAILCEQWLFEEIPADVAPEDGDGVVNFLDWAVFAEGWQIAEDYDSLASFAEQWLKTGSNYLNADIAPAPMGDKIVNMLDFAVLAENWLAGK